MKETIKLFALSVHPTVWVICLTILAATTIACLSFKDCGRYELRKLSDSSMASVFDTKSGLCYYTSNILDRVNAKYIRRRFTDERR